MYAGLLLQVTCHLEDMAVARVISSSALKVIQIAETGKELCQRTCLPHAWNRHVTVACHQVTFTSQIHKLPYGIAVHINQFHNYRLLHIRSNVSFYITIYSICRENEIIRSISLKKFKKEGL